MLHKRQSCGKYPISIALFLYSFSALVLPDFLAEMIPLCYSKFIYRKCFITTLVEQSKAYRREIHFYN